MFLSARIGHHGDVPTLGFERFSEGLGGKHMAARPASGQ